MVVLIRGVAALALGFAGGCHRGAEQQTRDAYAKARADKEAERTAAGGSGGSPEDLDTEGTGWARIGAMVRLAARELASGDSERLTALSERWCATEPTPQDTPYGPVVVCFPEPPIVAGGQGFSLEMGGSGMVGLVASSLSGPESRQLAEVLREQARSWCAGSFQAIASRQNAHDDLSSCPLDDGATLTVARLPRDLEADLWQVSLSLLGGT